MNADHTLAVAREQLGRMRGMTALYHKRFFADVRFVLVIVIALFTVGWWQVEEAFLLVPFVALWGAVQTAFDASYLIMSRHYAAALEEWINRQLDTDILLGSRLESTYLFPLGVTKIVTVPLGGQQTWFGFVTLFTTVGGLVAAVAGLVAGWDVLESASVLSRAGYWAILIVLTVSAFSAGLWWFIGGAGERRLEAVLAPLGDAR